MKLAAWSGEGVEGSVKRSKGMRDLGQDRPFHLCPALVQIPSPINWGATFWTPPPKNLHLDPLFHALQSRVSGLGRRLIKYPGEVLQCSLLPTSIWKDGCYPSFQPFQGPAPMGAA